MKSRNRGGRLSTTVIGLGFILSTAVGLLLPALTIAQPLSPGAGQPPPPGGPGGPPPGGPGAPPAASFSPVSVAVPVNSAMSLVHVGSSDSFAITPTGRQAATLLMEALQEGSQEKARAASALYADIIPKENFGGEYTALQFFADYAAADVVDRPVYLTDPQVAFFFETYGANDYAVLKEYLKRKYRLQEIGDEETRAGQDRKVWLEDTILFNNPRRESWEKTSELMKLIDLRPGMKVADVGSGPGYFTFRFASMVGPEGQVYAIDMVAQHLRYVESAKQALGAFNVSTIETDGRSLGLAEQHGKINAVYLCSLYHNVYAMATQPERDAFVNSIRDALADDGTLYLVDNGLVPPGTLPYHGPYIAKELVIAQLLNAGFVLESQHQHIAQRYLLVFKKAPLELSEPGH